jgi:hypothetical protein
MPTDYSIFWDLDDDADGNVQHLADHGLTKDDFEHALANATGFDISDSSGDEIAFGPALDGKEIAIVYQSIGVDVIRPVTAYRTED